MIAGGYDSQLSPTWSARALFRIRDLHLYTSVPNDYSNGFTV